jgi:UDP-glucuronate 4-epimerase
MSTSAVSSPDPSNELPAVLITGAAGFVGFHVAQALLREGRTVFGVDNLNDYYPTELKRARLAQLTPHPRFHFAMLDVSDRQALFDFATNHPAPIIVHLAAQVGVRYSVTNPEAYITSNLVGFGNILELGRRQRAEHLIYASSSSVYGANTRTPFSTEHNVDHPVSLYAATKKSNELMAHSYSHLYALPTTGLRFFTVYGPWGRPDMAVYSFTDAIEHGRPIQVYNHGQMKRDFTYIDDIVQAIVRLCRQPAKPDENWSSSEPNPGTSNKPYRVYNIGNSQPVPLLEMIETLERCLGKTAIKQFAPLQLGDVLETSADVTALTRDTGFCPSTPLAVGLQRFVEWYRTYHRPA